MIFRILSINRAPFQIVRRGERLFTSSLVKWFGVHMPLPATPTRLTAGSDIYRSTLIDDWVQGLGGDDTLAGGTGNDRLEGGDGRDLLEGGDGNDVLSGGTGDDRLLGGAGNDVLIGGAGNNRLEGGDGNDALHAQINDPVVQPSLLGSFDGGAGFDSVYFTYPAGTPSSGFGIPLVDGVRLAASTAQFQNIERFVGTLSNDTLDFSAYSAQGAAGDQTQPMGVTFDGRDGNDVALGTVHADVLIGGTGDDTLSGGNGNDRMSGGEGTDVLDGGAGDDTFTASGRDTVIGGDGYDTLTLSVEYSEGGSQDAPQGRNVSFSGIERFNGSAEADQLNLTDYSTGDPSAPDGVRVNLRGGDDLLYGTAYNDIVSGGDATDYLYGHLGNDKLYGDAGGDGLWGGDGNDTLNGGADDDYLEGNDGNDLLIGGEGVDAMIGGAGVDIAVLDGNRADYTFQALTDNTLGLPQDWIAVMARDGSIADYIKDVEFVRFADGRFAFETLLA
jgi:Ca2+-binding RTX toxin-like protein